MIFFDVTKALAAGHRSGLTRVSARLREELGDKVREVRWLGAWRDAQTRAPIELARTDWVLTPELFCEAERPGLWEFIKNPPCRLAAIFHDAIPLKFPQITWPQSVARHPEYMKMLSRFDLVLAVSQASRRELIDFWTWQGTAVRARVETLNLGADFLPAGDGVEVPRAAVPEGEPLLLSIGIVEPRKNQALLADVAEALVRDGVAFQLEIVGRINPHFGAPLERRLRQLAAQHRCIRFHPTADDATVARLWLRARASVFPTLTEGCGLPLLESLGRGVPCFCSDLPVLRENGEGGGVEFVPVNDRPAWTAALRRVLTDQAYAGELRSAAQRRVVATWRQTAQQIEQRLG